jgi:DNA mismatch repair protein MutS
MIYVNDLQIEKEVLPLFNYTHNEYAEETLLDILTEVPASVELILERQATIRGFLAHWDTLEDFSYKKIQFREVHTFLREVSNGTLILEANPLKAALKLWFSEEERYRSQAKCTQVVLFLRRIQREYFSRLPLADFPETFRRQLETIAGFMQKLDLEANAAAIEYNRFSLTHVVNFARALRKLDDDEVQAFWKAFYLFEAYWSIAKGFQHHRFVFPGFHHLGFRLTEFYHPLLKEPVKNTLELQPNENVVLLTGPNMSGKSTLLKAVGLCVYLAHVGVGVPAARCEIPFFHNIAIAINLSDSLQSGYSHFMAEVQNLKAVLMATHASGRTFAVFDELFRGTNVDDALDITRSTVQGLAEFTQSYFFVSTHLFQLENQLQEQASICKYYIDCSLAAGLPVFSYKLKAGWSDLKIGRLLFEKEGLNELLRVG